MPGKSHQLRLCHCQLLNFFLAADFAFFHYRHYRHQADTTNRGDIQRAVEIVQTAASQHQGFGQHERLGEILLILRDQRRGLKHVSGEDVRRPKRVEETDTAGPADAAAADVTVETDTTAAESDQ